jgi:polyhydroxyalkanoate synthesis regulator phasin
MLTILPLGGSERQVAAAAKEKAMQEASGDISRLEAEVAALQGENRQLKAEAQEAQRLKGYVAELEAQNARLEKQIAKMG